ncbi:NAD(P)/FAD-dependent oxidoreductase [Paracoccus aminophilus]|uniref:FAD dependent oxidoreductase n=1 Tax=Paracoccus aminophilus JCM 7686 TaxID=1367847 RepID=S5YY40_PARAH|nr:FAD-dependent oxidoreductase [Paracoccus aminophilus]AGT10091.1 FAD dependent oxidoreductase [Paracoccus aminophilus JCM 7686]
MTSEKIITVAGAGIFGLSCAWEILRRGGAVRVIEAQHIGAGSSGGTVGALAPHAPETWNPKKQIQLDALIGAADWWREIEDHAGLPSGYGRTGRLQPIAASALSRIEARIAGARQYWPDWARMEIRREAEGPLAPLSADGLWLYDNLTARLHPRLALAALAGAIRAKGGEIIEGTPADPETPAIWATGTAGLAPFGGNGVKGQSALLAFAAPDAPQVFADALHLVPHVDGTVGIGSTSEREVMDLATDDQLDALIIKARAICPGLEGAAVVDRWAGIRPRAKSRAPLIGAWPGRPGHIVANGGFKIGFGMAPAVAGMVADLALEGRDTVPEDFRTPLA